MKIRASALSILLLCSLTGCETLGLPDFTKDDEVPSDVRAQPVTINVPPRTEADQQWPHVGEVPFMPKDFSPKPVYDHYMNELAYDRDEAMAAKKDMVVNEPVSDQALAPVQSSGMTTPTPSPLLTAPQFKVK